MAVIKSQPASIGMGAGWRAVMLLGLILVIPWLLIETVQLLVLMMIFAPGKIIARLRRAVA